MSVRPNEPKGPYVEKAMDSLFQFFEAMEIGELSINDLEAIFKKAIESGFDNAIICLSMATQAMERAKHSIKESSECIH